MAFVAQCLVTVALFDQQIEALRVLFLMILIGALLDMPLFYAGMLLVFVALTFLKRSATLLRTAEVLRSLSGIEQKDNPRNRWIHLVGPLASFMIFVGVATVIIEIVAVYPAAVTDAYNTVQDFSDPKHVEGEPLNSEQRSIVERYSSTYPKIQFLSLDQDERLVENRIAAHTRDRRWLYVQSVLQLFAHSHVRKASKYETAQHFNALWRELEEELKTHAIGNSSPTPE